MKTTTATARRIKGLGRLAGSSLRLTRAASRQWEDGGPDGDRYRRVTRRTIAAMAGDHDLRQVEVSSADGIVLEVMTRVVLG